MRYATLLHQIKSDNIVRVRCPVKNSPRVGQMDVFDHHGSVHEGLVFVVKGELDAETLPLIQGDGNIYEFQADAVSGQVNDRHKAGRPR